MSSGNITDLQTVRATLKPKRIEITPERLLRIKQRVNELDLKLGDVAKGIGISVSTVSQMLHSKIKSSSHFGPLATVLQVNLAWLLAETDQRIDMRDLDGAPISEAILPEMLKSDAFTAARVATVKVEDEDALNDQATTDMVTLREIDLSHSFGTTFLGVPAKDRPHFFSRAMLANYTASEPGHVMIAQRIGDAMQPTILDSDLLLVDTTHRTLDRADKLWAVLHCGAGMIARLRPTTNGVRIIADNPTIPDDIAEPGDLEILGLVVGLIRKL